VHVRVKICGMVCVYKCMCMHLYMFVYETTWTAGDSTDRRVCLLIDVTHARASHQPRQSIWELNSLIIVLAKGWQLFFGSPAHAQAWFTTGFGLNLPPGVPTAEFIM